MAAAAPGPRPRRAGAAAAELLGRLRDRSQGPGRAAEALEAFLQDRSSLRCCGTKDCTGLLTALGRRRMWQAALTFLGQLLANEAPGIDTIVFNAAISACEKAGRWALALGVLAELGVRGLLPDVVSYSAAISACEKGRQWPRALALLAEMPARAADPNVITYNAAISACQKGKQASRVPDLLREMRGQQLTPDTISYNAAISACEDWQSALAFFKEMDDMSIERDVVSHNSLVTACERDGCWERALSVLQELRAADLEPDVVAFSAAVSACEKGLRWEWAMQLLAEMRRSGILPNVFTCSAAISACGSGRQWERAVALLGEAWEAGFIPNVVTYSAAISACEGGRQWELGLHLLGEMRQLSLEPNLVSFNNAVSACEKGGQWQWALALLAEARQAGLVPDLASCAAATGVHQEELRRDIARWGVGRDVTVFGAAVLACEADGASREAPGFLQALRRSAGGLLSAAPGAALTDASGADDAVVALEHLRWSGALASALLSAFALAAYAPALSRLLVLCGHGSPGASASRCTTGAAGDSAQAWRLHEPVLEQRFSLGDAFTSAALRDTGLQAAATAAWAPRASGASRRAFRAQGLTAAEELMALAVAAWLGHTLRGRRQAASLLLDCGGRDAGHADSNEDGASAKAEDVTEHVGRLLLPVFAGHDRSPHAERQALLSLLRGCRGRARGMAREG